MPRKPFWIWVTAWLSIYMQYGPHGASSDTVDAKPASNRRQARAVLGLICGWLWNLVFSEKSCNCPAHLTWKRGWSMGLLRVSLCYPRTALCCPIFLQTHRAPHPGSVFIKKNFFFEVIGKRNCPIGKKTQTLNKETIKGLNSESFEFPCGQDLWFLIFLNLALSKIVRRLRTIRTGEPPCPTPSISRARPQSPELTQIVWGYSELEEKAHFLPFVFFEPYVS